MNTFSLFVNNVTSAMARTKKGANAPLAVQRTPTQAQQVPETGIGDSQFSNTSRSALAQTTKGLQAAYSEKLQAAFENIKELLLDVAKDTGFTYEQVEKDTFAYYATLKRARRVGAWNMFTREKMQEENEGTYIVSI
jgi:hypothetical protein